MKKFWIQLAILLVIIFGALYLFSNEQALTSFLGETGINQTSPSSGIKKLQINSTQAGVSRAVINVEVADSSAKRTKGLSGRESMSADSGMLFVFPETKKYQFWMKDVKFPLDFIFIKDGIIVDIIKNVPAEPGKNERDLTIYEPTQPVNMMLEVNANFSDSNNIQVGDSISILE